MNVPGWAVCPPRLQVDRGAGVVLEAPGVAVVSRQWAEEHPWVLLSETHLTAGPDAHGVGLESAIYRVDREVAGFFHMTRVA